MYQKLGSYNAIQYNTFLQQKNNPSDNYALQALPTFAKKTYNKHEPPKDWMDLNFDQELTSQQTHFTTIGSSSIKFQNWKQCRLVKNPRKRLYCAQ